MTRTGYLLMQATGLVIVLTALAVVRYWPRPRPAINPTSLQIALLTLLDWLPAIGLIALLGEALETFLVLFRFAKKQAEADRQNLHNPAPGLTDP